MKNLILLLLLTACSTSVKKVDPEPSFLVFSHKSSLSWVKELKDTANCVVENEDFKKEVSEIESFDYSEDNGSQVVEKLSKVHCIVSTYKTRNPFSKAIATTYASDKTTFYLNLRKNPRIIKYMVNTSVHECLHLAGYSHGSNSSIGKENTVNYKVGKTAEKYVEKCKALN